MAINGCLNGLNTIADLAAVQAMPATATNTELWVLCTVVHQS